MRHHPFGPGERPVPVIGQETWDIDEGDRALAIAAQRRDLDLDMTYIDTAEIYGDAKPPWRPEHRPHQRSRIMTFRPLHGRGVVRLVKAEEKKDRVHDAIHATGAAAGGCPSQWIRSGCWQASQGASGGTGDGGSRGGQGGAPGNTPGGASG